MTSLTGDEIFQFINHGGLRLNFGDGLRPGFDPARSPWAKIG